jgi:putative spermidine/putrescine transport system permease protein
VLGLLLLSLGGMIGASFTYQGNLSLEYFRQFFARKDYVNALIYTHESAFLTSAVCALIGYPVAAYIARYQGNRNHLLLLVFVPWLVSVVVRTYGWIVILGARGIFNQALIATGVVDTPLRLVFNATGVTIGMVHVLTPFMIISILSVFMDYDYALEEAGMSLGARPVERFFRITLPMTLPGVLSGAILVYLLAVGAIVTPMLLGGVATKTTGTQIYDEIFATFNFAKATAIAVVLVVSSLVVVVPLSWMERRLRTHRA